MSPGGSADGAAPLDRAKPVRAGEELPVEPLAAWLARELPDFVSGAAELTVEQFPGGHSNLTYLLRSGDRELVLRRPPHGSTVRTAHDMGREHRVLSRLATVYPKAPRALAACPDPAVIGAPFYVMERVRGIILRHPRPPRGVALTPEVMRHLSQAAVDGLAELHAVSPEAAGLADLGRPDGYAARQVAGWGERWQKARTEEMAEVERAFAWLAGQPPPPPSGPPALLHNDYKYDNLVLAPDLQAIVAVLDWEMATLGEPLLDLGTSLGYWMDPDDDPELLLLPTGPTTLPGGLSRAEVVERYAARSGRDVSGILFAFVYGLLKIAVIAQQIYFRYAQGLTRDERFAQLPRGIRVLGRAAAQAIDKGRIDRLMA
ncbi:MAG TPA: phosphotransferase family protein [Thermoanaerobaculia bacterium]